MSLSSIARRMSLASLSVTFVGIGMTATPFRVLAKYKCAAPIMLHARAYGVNNNAEEDEQSVEKAFRPSVVGAFTHQGGKTFNEDRLVVGTAAPFNVVGVFDGHGGSLAVDYVREQVLPVMRSVIAEGELNGKLVLTKTIERLTDGLFEMMSERMSVEQMTSGTTASIAITCGPEIVCAQVGDSRIIIGTDGHSKQLTADHRPSNVDEMERVILAGGKITYIGTPRVGGKLAMTRAIGSFAYRDQGVIAIPDIAVHTVDPSKDGVLVLGTDGLFDELTNEEVFRIVSDCDTPHDAATELGDVALSYHARDNVTAVVVRLPAWGTNENRNLPPFTYDRNMTKRSS
eukprot:m.71460 g.71460  ORF g.71460 m.71460 type:complete len:344 (+) comp8348_c0_seq4:289-1320(+)